MVCFSGGGVGAEALGGCGAEEGEDGFFHGCGEVHGAAVVGDDEAGVGDEGDHVLDGGFSGGVNEVVVGVEFWGGDVDMAVPDDDLVGVELEDFLSEFGEFLPFFFGLTAGGDDDDGV